jgi:hypothetical protein
MKYRPWAMLGIGILMTTGLVAVKPGFADEHNPKCTLKTAKGRYLFAQQGAELPPAFGVTEPTADSISSMETGRGQTS